MQNLKLKHFLSKEGISVAFSSNSNSVIPGKECINYQTKLT